MPRRDLEQRQLGGVIERHLLDWEKNYTEIPNDWIRDRALTLKARGLLTLLLSHKAGYSMSLKQLEADGHGGLGLLRTAAEELEHEQYLVRIHTRTSEGTYRTRWRLQTPPKHRVQKSHAADGEQDDRVQLSDADNCTHKEPQESNPMNAVPKATTEPCPRQRFMPCAVTPAGVCATCGRTMDGAL